MGSRIRGGHFNARAKIIPSDVSDDLEMNAPSVRPAPFLNKTRLRSLVRAGEREDVRGLSVWSTPSLTTLVPSRVLWRAAPGQQLHRDALLNSTLSTVRQRSGRMGVAWCPPLELRGRYARAALYVASIGPYAADLVDDEVVDIETVLEWDHDHPMDHRDHVRAALAACYQGPWVLRDNGSRLVWVERRAASLEHLSSDMRYLTPLERNGAIESDGR